MKNVQVIEGQDVLQLLLLYNMFGSFEYIIILDILLLQMASVCLYVCLHYKCA